MRQVEGSEEMDMGGVLTNGKRLALVLAYAREVDCARALVPLHSEAQIDVALQETDLRTSRHATPRISNERR